MDNINYENEMEAIDAKYQKYIENDDMMEEGNTLEDTSSINEELLKTEWIKEAEQIPLDMVSPLEKKYIEKLLKYGNFGYELHDEEKTIIAEILDKYRPAIQDITPDQVIQNLKDNTRIVSDEKEFLNLCDEFDTVQVIPFTFYHNEKCYRMKFDLYPITDSEAITNISDNLSLFKELNDEELVTYNKVQNGEKLTREEIIIRAGLEQKIQKLTQKNARQTVVEFLSMQLKFHGKDSTVESMKQVFMKIPFTYLALLFQEVQNKTHLTEMKTEDVFQKFD